MKADEEAAKKEKEKPAEESKTPVHPKTKIRPLSEAKAIDSGANFISETFLFMVAGGLIVFETWRSRRKESTRRDDVAGRLEELEESEKQARRALVELEKEILRLRAKDEKDAGYPKRILPKDIREVEEDDEKEDKLKAQGWFGWVRAFGQSSQQESEPKPVEKSTPKLISSTSSATAMPEDKALQVAQKAQERPVKSEGMESK